MKDWNELLENDEESGVGEKVLRFCVRHGAIVVVMVLVVALIVSVNIIRSTKAENEGLKEDNALLRDA